MNVPSLLREGGRLMSLLILSPCIFSSAAAHAQSQSATPPFAALPESWSGLYVGATAGQAFAYSSLSTNPLLTAPGADTLSRGQGLAAGFYLGFTQQVGAFVLGVEGDFSSLSPSDRLTDVDPGIGLGVVASEVTKLATVRARLGYLLSPSLLVYGTAGVAIAHVRVSQAYALWGPAGPFIYASRGAGSASGWIAGLGVECAMNRNLTLRLEYLYADFGAPQFREGSDLSGAYLFNPTLSLARAGASWRF